MADLKEKAVALLGSVDDVDLNDDASSTTIYTVPTGKKCVLDHVRLRNISGNCTNATCTVGKSGALTDFLGTQTLSGLNAAASTGILRPLPNATTVKGIEYVATNALVFRVVVAASVACTATVEFFGTIDDA
ncbi:unnamed protein product [marine sediment metagenome]|uniref:Uncharacterized protein n=1 Tax=marine sediment metagenome TaxID=412755 RepID=X1BKC1_9ZZZZ